MLRSLGYHQPIYALTANAMSHEISQYLAIGFTGHLKKPIERKNFIAIIAKHFPDNIEVKPKKQQDNESPAQFLTENERVDKAEESLTHVDLSDLITEFKINISEDKRELVFHGENDDIDKLGQVAHRLAGAAQMFGFIELNQAAKELESIIKREAVNNKPNHQLISELAHCLVDEINLIEQQ
jgi:HPt (histidine-containing phosphotransfer) domain-containing protein